MSKTSLRKILSYYERPSDRLFIFLRYLILPFRFVDENLPKSGKILDVGCGHGMYALHSRLCEPGRIMVGCELNRKKIDSALAATKGISGISFEIRDLTKANDFDDCIAIAIIDVLHHLDPVSQRGLLRDCQKKLNKDGMLLIKDVDHKPRWKYWYNRFHDETLMRGPKIYPQPKEMVDQMLKDLKFKTEFKRVSTWWPNPIPHYMILARK